LIRVGHAARGSQMLRSVIVGDRAVDLASETLGWRTVSEASEVRREGSPPIDGYLPRAARAFRELIEPNHAGDERPEFRPRHELDGPLRDAQEIASSHPPKGGAQLLDIDALTHRR
jgi:hypothetical protein